MRHSILFFFLTLLFLLGCGNERPKPLMVATAANLQYAMKDIQAAFTAETQVPCEVILGSSGKLTAQIKEGAPFDVFVSANMKYPQELYSSGFSLEPPSIYAYGKLVLWSIEQEEQISIERLTSPGLRYIALANPKTAPYGEAAKEVLESYQLYQSLEDKLVYGESISQTNQFIMSGAAEIGFTAKSVVLSPMIKDKGTWIDISDSLYTSIAQGVLVIKNTESLTEEARLFHDFLFSSKAEAILTAYGYEVKK